MSERNLEDTLYEEYVKNGYEENWNRAREALKPLGLEHIVDLAEVGLFVTEISEMMEELRMPQVDMKKLEKEGADIAIRVSNFLKCNGLSMYKGMREKHLINMQREKLHGKKI